MDFHISLTRCWPCWVLVEGPEVLPVGGVWEGRAEVASPLAGLQVLTDEEKVLFGTRASPCVGLPGNLSKSSLPGTHLT